MFPFFSCALHRYLSHTVHRLILSRDPTSNGLGPTALIPSIQTVNMNAFLRSWAGEGGANKPDIVGKTARGRTLLYNVLPIDVWSQGERRH
jgi:hypothetical protein